MKLQFQLEYRTAWGEDVRVEILLKRRRGADVKQIHQLNTQDGLWWSGEVVIHEKDAVTFSYNYIIARDEEVVRREWCGVPRTFPYDQHRIFLLHDYWKEIPQLSHLYSSAYSHCVAQTLSQDPQITYYDRTLLFRVQAPQLVKGQQLALLGSLPQLGEWMPERAIKMTRGGTHEWCLTLSATGLNFPFEYKYVVVNEEDGSLLLWEEGENRTSPHLESLVPEGFTVEHQSAYHMSSSIPLPQNTVQVIWDRRLRMPDEHWKAAGVVIPVFSLRSEGSQGVGDFGDLRMLVDWANRTSMRVIQLLPIYDTTQTSTWTDCYPYNAISIYALHPLYLDLRSLPRIADEAYMQMHYQERDRLNSLPLLDYECSLQLKLDYLHRLYEQDGATILASAPCKEFIANPDSWQ